MECIDDDADGPDDRLPLKHRAQSALNELGLRTPGPINLNKFLEGWRHDHKPWQLRVFDMECLISFIFNYPP